VLSGYSKSAPKKTCHFPTVEVDEDRRFRAEGEIRDSLYDCLAYELGRIIY